MLENPLCRYSPLGGPTVGRERYSTHTFGARMNRPLSATRMGKNSRDTANRGIHSQDLPESLAAITLSTPAVRLHGATGPLAEPVRNDLTAIDHQRATVFQVRTQPTAHDHRALAVLRGILERVRNVHRTAASVRLAAADRGPRSSPDPQLDGSRFVGQPVLAAAAISTADFEGGRSLPYS
jgi:hypothetical protein